MIQESFMKWQQISYKIVQYFHIFDYREDFVEISIDVLTKRKFPIKDKAKIFLGVFWSKNRVFQKSKIQRREVEDF